MRCSESIENGAGKLKQMLKCYVIEIEFISTLKMCRHTFNNAKSNCNYFVRSRGFANQIDVNYIYLITSYHYTANDISSNIHSWTHSFFIVANVRTFLYIEIKFCEKKSTKIRLEFPLFVQNWFLLMCVNRIQSWIFTRVDLAFVIEWDSTIWRLCSAKISTL